MLYLYKVNKEVAIWARDKQNAKDIFNGLFDELNEHKDETERIDSDEIIYFATDKDDIAIYWELECDVKYTSKSLTVRKFKKRMGQDHGEV